MQQLIDMLVLTGPALAKSLALLIVQGLVIGVVALVVTRLLARRSAQTRYAVCLGALGLMLLCLPINLVVFWDRDAAGQNMSVTSVALEPQTDAANESIGAQPLAAQTDAAQDRVPLSDLTVEQWAALDEKTRSRPEVLPRVWNSRHESDFDPSEMVLVPRPDGAANESAALPGDRVATPSAPSAWQRWAPWVVSAYGVGLSLFLLRLLVALHGGWRLTRSARRIDHSDRLWALVQEQAHHLGLGRSRVPGVGLLSSRLSVGGPILVGLLRPMILLPAAVLAQLTPSQLEAVIAHELAHIRRRDPLWIFLQRMTETLLFFHPMVWVISRKLSQEREHACDDLVLSGEADPSAYATALVRVLALSSGGTRTPVTAAALSREALHQRISRLFGEQDGGRLRLARAGLEVCLATLALVGIAVAVIACQSRPMNDGDPGVETQVDAESADADSLENQGEPLAVPPARAWTWSSPERIATQGLRRSDQLEAMDQLIADDPRIGEAEGKLLVLTERDWHALSAEDLVALFDKNFSNELEDQPLRLSDAPALPGVPTQWGLTTRVIAYKTEQGQYGMARLQDRTGWEEGTPGKFVCEVRRALKQPERRVLLWSEEQGHFSARFGGTFEKKSSIGGLALLEAERSFEAKAGLTYIFNLESQGVAPRIELIDEAGDVLPSNGSFVDQHRYRQAWTASKSQRMKVVLHTQVDVPDPAVDADRITFLLDIDTDGRVVRALPPDNGTPLRGAVELSGTSAVMRDTAVRFGRYDLPRKPGPKFRVYDLLLSAGFDLNLLPWHRVDIVRTDAETGNATRITDVRVLPDSYLGRNVKPQREMHLLEPGDRVELIPRDLVEGDGPINPDRKAQGWGKISDGLNARWLTPSIEIEPDQDTVTFSFEVRNLTTQDRLWRTEADLYNLPMAFMIHEREKVVSAPIRSFDLSYDYRDGARMASEDEVKHGPNPYGRGLGVLPPGGRIEYVPHAHLLSPGSTVRVTVTAKAQRIKDLQGIYTTGLHLLVNPDRNVSIGLRTNRGVASLDLGQLDTIYKPEPDPVGNPAWGGAVDGVRAALEPVKVDRDDNPVDGTVLRAYVQDPGNKDLFLANHPNWQNCMLVIDGEWYVATGPIRWAGQTQARSTSYTRDSAFQFLLQLSGEDKLGSRWVSEQRDGEPLKLSPGKHTACFYWGITRRGDEDLTRADKRPQYLKTGLIEFVVPEDDAAETINEEQRPRLGPVITLDDSRGKYIDLDTGRFVDPATIQGATNNFWIPKRAGETESRVNLWDNPLSSTTGLSGRLVELVALPDKAFDKVTAEDVLACWDKAGLVNAGYERSPVLKPIGGTFVFRTADSRVGVVEMTSREPAPGEEAKRTVWTVRLRHLEGKLPFTRPGEAAEGVSLHLWDAELRTLNDPAERIDQADGTLRPLITFGLRARHEGERMLHLPTNKYSYQINVDGTWYACVPPQAAIAENPAFGLGGELFELRPMDKLPKHYAVSASRELGRYWYAITAEDIEQEGRISSGWGGAFGVREREDYGKELVLTPGEHTVQVAITLGPGFAIQGHSSVRVVSNPLTIRVPKPAQAKPASTQKRGAAQDVDKPEAEPVDPGIAVTGRVLDKPGGAPVKGVKVTLVDDKRVPFKQAVTDEQGRYVFDGVTSIGMVHYLRVGEHGPGVWTDDARVFIPNINERWGMESVEADELYTQTDCTLKGVVTDAQTGKGIPGIPVRISTIDKNYGTVVTDDKGAFRLHTVSREVTIDCEGDRRYYDPPMKPAQGQDQANARSRTFTLKPGQVVEGVNFKLQSAPSFSGQLLMPDGKPAAGVAMVAHIMFSALEPIEQDGPFRSFGGMGFSATMQTDEQGRFNGYLRSPFGQTQRASVDIIFLARTQDVQFAAYHRINRTTDDGPLEDVRLQLLPTGWATLTLVGPDGERIPNAQLGAGTEINGYNFSGSYEAQLLPLFTDLGDGRYLAEGLMPTWQYGFQARPKGYRTTRELRVDAESGKRIEAGELKLDWWGPKAVPGLIEQLQAEDKSQRERACHALRGLGPDAALAVEPLIEALTNDPANTVRYNAADALGAIGKAAAPAIPQLMYALEHDKDGVPEASATALGDIGDEQAVHALVRMSNHEERGLRLLVIASLGRIGGDDAVTALLQLVRGGQDSKTRVQTIEALIDARSPRALPVLEEIKDDDDRAVRRAAEEAIRKLTYLLRDRAARVQ